jgi:hypothetical protein
MNEKPINPLEGHALAALRTERARPGAPLAAKDHVKARLMMSLPVAIQPDVLRTMRVRAVPRGLGWAGPLVAAFVTGGIAGASLHAVLAPSAPGRVTSVQTAVPVATPVPIPTVPAVVSADAVDTTEPPSRLQGGAARPPVESDLKAERLLLDKARAALGRGDDNEALAIIDAHGQKFQRGRLAEEREALAVKALVNTGRVEEARQRGARFRSRYPQSVLLPAVENALATIP